MVATHLSSLATTVLLLLHLVIPSHAAPIASPSTSPPSVIPPVAVGGAPTTTNIPLPPIFRSMGGFSPYAKNSKGYGIEDVLLPDNCVVDQVTSLMRHGMRFASTGTGKGIQATFDRIGNSTYQVHDPNLDVLKGHVYGLPVELLTDWGRRDLYDAGKMFADRYDGLLKHQTTGTSKVLLRTTDQERMHDSALAFAYGSLGVDQEDKTRWVVVPDASPTFNTTLAVGTCPVLNMIVEFSQSRPPSHLRDLSFPHHPSAIPKADTLGIFTLLNNVIPSAWATHYLTPIATRLNAGLNNLTLTPTDVSNIMSSCPFETAAHNHVSPTCGLFTEEEWEGYSYYQDLQQYVGSGYGGPLGRAWGVGWVNELTARLKGEQVRDRTSTNSTLDHDDLTFPLTDAVYLDFAHDTQFNSILATLGLVHDPSSVMTADRPTPDPTRLWKTPNMASMGGRLWVERIVCSPSPPNNTTTNTNTTIVPVSTAPGKCPSATTKTKTTTAATTKSEMGSLTGGTYVRLVLNEAVLPLDGLAGCEGEGSEAGMCRLDGFVEAQRFAAEGGDWRNCYATDLTVWQQEQK
ncbi:hypothetical protein HKX48_002204 [Thoreauomyces humboldtii]|nr:hypothetical protein HKX48_002204 [Thoreauomyces humboldtii]